MKGACWRYEEPYQEAAIIAGRVAFWNGVKITGAPEGRGLVEKSPSLRNGKTGWEALCWLLRNTDKTVLSPADIAENTDIEESAIEAAWRVYEVERYARPINGGWWAAAERESRSGSKRKGEG